MYLRFSQLMIKRPLTLVLSWYFTCLSVLAFALLFLFYSTHPRQIITQLGPQYQLYQALPDSMSEQSVQITASDARTALVANFFKSYKAPLSDQAEIFVRIADKYGLDFRLIPAISMQESNGGKILPDNSYNAFGYGIYGSQVLRFNSWEESIEKVAKGLKNNYIDKGLRTPYEIMTKYTPPSVAKGGPWAIGVTSFMAEIH